MFNRRPMIAMPIAALLNAGIGAGNPVSSAHEYLAPAGSRPNQGFKRNRRAELKKSARKAAK